MNLGRAISIAAQGFQNITDKGGQPYILHCIRVMNQMDTEEEKIVAILHDVIEDSISSLEDLIKERFSQNIIYALILLTHEKGQPYDDYIKKISTDKLATKVKLADLKDNSDITRLKDLDLKDLKRVQKYHKAYCYLQGL